MNDFDITSKVVNDINREYFDNFTGGYIPRFGIYLSGKLFKHGTLV